MRAVLGGSEGGQAGVGAELEGSEGQAGVGAELGGSEGQAGVGVYR